MLKTKIVATLGPATSSRAVLAEMLCAGVDVVRINCSHGTRHGRLAEVALVREVAAECGRRVAVLADLQGPKMRVGTLGDEGVELAEGATVRLRAGAETAEPGVIPVTYLKLAADVQAGDRVLLADGMLELRVLAVEGFDVLCEVVLGGRLHSRKGVNLPGVAVTAQSPTIKDIDDLSAMVEAGVDYVALSFVRSADDVRRLREAIVALGASTLVVAKLERPEAIERLEEILAVSDAVMVARGDLGVEMGPAQVPVLQKRIIAAANARAIPVITATEMLESMVTSVRPTRAEASDVANAVFDGTSAVMLSAETAVGVDPAEVVRWMCRIVASAEAAPELDTVVAAPHGAISPARAVARSVVQVVQDLGAVAVVVHTQTGSSSRLVSSFRPGVPILALSPAESTVRLVALHHGVQGDVVPAVDDSLDLMAQANHKALTSGLAQDGDTIIVVAGAPGQVGGTNRMLVHRVDASLHRQDTHAPVADLTVRRSATEADGPGEVEAEQGVQVSERLELRPGGH
ncbi:MAG TPA: pyruvate kinase [Mycobacteriales bacterium]|nr:pyruvate kinase [Mycobacteriales bacterium]